MILSCAAEYTLLPQRLAGTCSTYSKNAIPQLVRMTNRIGFSLYFKCPYHAKVMKMFEQMSGITGSQRELVSAFMVESCQLGAFSLRRQVDLPTSLSQRRFVIRK